MKKIIDHFKRYNPYSLYAAKSELKSEVSNSYLTWMWWILDPLCFMMVYTFIVEVVFKSKEAYFPVMVFIGLTVWNFFNKCVNISVKLVSANKGIVSKIYVPKYMLVLEKMYVNGIKMLISYLLLFGLAFLFKVPFTFNILYSIPLLFLTFLITFCVSTLLEHFGVFIDDMANIIRILLQLTFYLSGVFYTISTKLPETYYKIMVHINPIAYIIDDFRNVFVHGESLNFLLFGYWIIIGLVVSIIAIKIIYKHENTYVKVI